MSIAFSQSLRSLQADRNRSSLIVLSLIGLLFLGWLLWFFFSHFTLYETGQIVQTSSDGVILASFPPTAQNRVQLGQAAQLYLAGAEQSQSIPATVAGILQPSTADEQIQVIIYADMDTPNVALLQDGLTGQATVAVAQLSPASLILRASGLGTDTAPVSFDSAP